MNDRLSLRRAWQSRSRREQWLLAAALIGSLLASIYWLADNRLMLLVERTTLTETAPPPLVRSLPPVTPVEANLWKRTALEHGLVLNTIEVQDNSVITQGEARSPEALVAFSRWAAQRGWWALEWTLTQETEANLTLEARWMSRLEESPFVRRAP